MSLWHAKHAIPHITHSSQVLKTPEPYFMPQFAEMDEIGIVDIGNYNRTPCFFHTHLCALITPFLC